MMRKAAEKHKDRKCMGVRTIEECLVEGKKQFWRKGDYADGAPVGVWREWHDNGQLASEGELVPEPDPEEDWFTLDDDGVKSSVRAGTWREWWPNGRLRAEGEWQDGFPVEPHRWWHEDGTPSERRIGG